MHPSTELARPPGVDSKHRRLSTGYWPIAFAAVGCAVVITIAFETQDLSHQRAARERGKSAHDKDYSRQFVDEPCLDRSAS